MKPDDLSRLSIPSEVRIAPRSDRHAFVVLTPDMMSRSGWPKHRVERFEAILDWHDRHLR